MIENENKEISLKRGLFSQFSLKNFLKIVMLDFKNSDNTQVLLDSLSHNS